MICSRAPPTQLPIMTRMVPSLCSKLRKKRQRAQDTVCGKLLPPDHVAAQRASTASPYAGAGASGMMRLLQRWPLPRRPPQLLAALLLQAPGRWP